MKTHLLPRAIIHCFLALLFLLVWTLDWILRSLTNNRQESIPSIGTLSRSSGKNGSSFFWADVFKEHCCACCYLSSEPLDSQAFDKYLRVLLERLPRTGMVELERSTTVSQ